MRYRSTLLLRKTGLGALAALLFALASGAAQAQLPVFDGVDWLLDRGNLTFDATTTSGIPHRPGLNDINNVANNPGHAVRRWVFPRTRDLTNGALVSPTRTVDNPSATDPQNFSDTSGNNVRTQSAYAMQAGLDPQQMAHAYLNNGVGAWTLPLVPADRSLADYRSPSRGFSFTSDTSKDYSYDYAFTPATHNDFLVTDDQGITRPARGDELALMPYSSTFVYAGVQNALVNDTHPTATYSSGAYGMLQGTYGVEIHSPGDGTKLAGIPHASVSHAFVRVSWFRTVDATGNIVKANTDNPTFSRIYEVDLGNAGWIKIQGGGTAPAEFPYDGDPRDQIAVTIYSITPDTTTGVGVVTPVVTADAVRFIVHSTVAGNTSLGPISASGRILGPVAGTNKVLKTLGGAPIADVQPLIYLAREETIPDPTPRILTDPTQPFGPGNPLIPDPTATLLAPVFYCLDSQNGNVPGANADGFLAAIERVRWRYVGIADLGSGTSFSSPVIANVRCRDGVTRTMVYFMSSNTATTSGHIYAFDAAGDRPTLTTQNYWTYPSYRPLTPAEQFANKLPPEEHDPNYKSFVQGPYPVPAWGADIADPFFHYDGEIIKNPANANEFTVRTDTRVPGFGGMQGSPLIIDDPSAPAGGQILVIGNINGRVYAFDAGGRGDFDPANGSTLGTTQRIWTWPHLRGDAYYAKGLVGNNTIKNDDTGIGSILGSPSYDPNYNAPSLLQKPIFIPGGDGRLYAINAPHDVPPTLSQNNTLAKWQERKNWVYPNTTGVGLAGPISTVAIFQPNGAAFPYVYFTCVDKVYALQEVPPVIGPSIPTVNTTKWIYQADTASGVNSFDFGIAPPVLISQAMLNSAPAFAGNGAVNNDFCYALETNGILHGINAFNGALIASGASQSNTTNSAPIATQLIGLPGIAPSVAATTKPQPAIVFSDTAGAIFGLSARPDNANPGPIPGSALLSQIWYHGDANSVIPQATRNAPASLVNGLILEGDYGGQLHAYGLGTGINGLGETLGPGEPPEVALGAGDLSIDLRVVDIYKKDDFDLMMLTSPPGSAGKRTANRKNAGGGYTNSALPAPGNINATKAFASDWGDYLYVVAAGVYHAQPTDDPLNILHGTNTPRIHVTFSLTQNGGVSIYEGDVPVTTQAVHSLPGELWPDDLALTDAEHDALKIYGNDPNLGPAGLILTGRNQNVYPWIFKYAIPIYPGATTSNGNIANFVPGSANYRLTARAEISQDQAAYDPGTMTTTSLGTRTQGTPTYAAGQADYNGLVGPFQTPFYLTSVLGTPRTYAVTNPIALTTRGLTNLNDMTGPLNRNVVGLFPSINSPGPKPANVGELIGNGNRQVVPGVNSLNPAVKAAFAPLPMVPDGSTSTYKAVDNFGNPQDAFYIVDRSNFFGMRGRPLLVQVLTRKLAWHGWNPATNPTSTASAVMNALPWEQYPTDGQDSLDYPSIPATAFGIRKSTGEDAIGGLVTLATPDYSLAAGNETLRKLVATSFSLEVKVPRYQPANVNYGVNTFGGITFGSSFVDMAGINRGDPAAASAYDRHLLGPLITNNGGQAVLGSGPVYPAAGYVSDLVVRVVPTGLPRTTAGFNPVAFFTGARTGINAGVNEAYRAFETGIAVPPGVKMRVAESVLDVGKVPHGTGYTPLTNLSDARSFQVPFAPDMSPSAPGPFFWDDPSRGGEFFRPFTLYNESNVNLVDVRMAKLLGQNYSQIDGRTLSQYTDITAGNENTAVAASLQIPSDQVNGQSISPLYAVPFKNVSGAPGVGNAGVVSSFDHISSSSNPVTSLFAERALWPLANPYVVQADIDAATQNYGAILPTANNLVNGIYGWTGGFQPQPTIGKPRVGDPQGRTASIPDQPYSGTSALPRPRIGIAVPLGTPVGTYSAPIYAFEDNTPLQWQEWLSHYGKPAGVSQNYPVSHDGILNVTQAGSPSEAHSDPPFRLKLTVREAKMTREPTNGTLAMLDTFGSWLDPSPQGYNMPPGSDNFPAAFMAPGNGGSIYNRNMFTYWTTNRRLSADSYISPNNGLQKVFAPYTWAYSRVPAPYSAVSGTNIILGDFDFAKQLGLAGNGTPLSGWWDAPTFTQYTNATVYNLFPSTPSATTPFLTGTANVDTMRLSHPAVASSLDFSGGYNNLNANDPESYLFWPGQVDKATAVNSGQFQTRDSRISWQRLFGGAAPGVPFGTIYSAPNDPTLTKLAPKPLLVKLPAANGAPAQKFLYVFWHQGNQSNASLYYNAMTSTNMGTAFDNTQWLVDAGGKYLGDLKLPTSGSLVWQSDAAPIYRHIPDPSGSGLQFDVIDVVFTGVLKGRQTVETLLSRYKINRVPPVNPGDPPVGSLTLLPVRRVIGEVLTRLGNTNTFQGRDAAWSLGTGPQGTLLPADMGSLISIYQTTGNLNSAPVLLNAQAGINPPVAQLGRYDQASGLLFYDSALGGQIVVDMRSGTVRFPQVAPGLADRLQVNYIPYVMRLNTSRDDSNIDRSSVSNFGNLAGARGFQPTAAITSSGNNTNPVVIFDRGFNSRAQLVSPQVVFSPPGTTPTLDRLWALYRKNDASGVARSTIYYKAMRLMVKLPYPVQLAAPMNGSQQITPFFVVGNQGPYEVDYVRGRIYFTERDENSRISVNYTYYDPVSKQAQVSGTMFYRVAWGDEISASIQQGDQTTPEVVLPTDSAVSEGQVAAFKDPFLDKLWVFWSSTRAGSTDLYFETIAPQFYPAASNQR